MKQTRLLEIIREEIAGALNEAGLGDQITALDKQIEAATKQIAPLQKKLADFQGKKADLQKKEADLSTKTQSQLEEDLLNEMAWDIVIAQPDKLAKLQDTIKDSTKKGEQQLAKALEIIQKTKKEGKPIRQRDIANEMGLIQQKINPLINKLIDVGILEKGESVTGVTKKKVTDKAQGRPASEKPKAEPKAKIEKTPKAEPKNIGSEDSEAPAGDVEIEKAARGGDELIKQYRNVMDTYKNMKSEEGDQAALEYLKTKQDIVKKYKAMQAPKI